MKLLYITPTHKTIVDLQFWFILEAVFICINYVLFISGIILAIKVRIHINLKILGVACFLQYILNLTIRLIILAYQAGVLPRPKNPEENLLLVACCWYRTYNFGCITSILFWASIERELSIHYIRDYEKERRLWIPLAIVVVAIFCCSLAATIFVFQWLPWYPVALFALGIVVLGSVMFFNNYRNTYLLYQAVKHHRLCKHKYTLSLRYQLHENLWCGRLLKNGFIALTAINLCTFGFFLPAHSEVIRDNYGEEITQLFDCLYNLFIAINGPVIAIFAICYNKYLTNTVKEMFFGHVKEPEQEPGQVYFVELERQWHRPQSRPPTPRRKRF